MLALLGWALDIPALKSVFPGLATMKPNTALAFLLAGLGLWLLGPEQAPARRRRAGQFCALAVALIGLLTLTEYFFGWNLAMDDGLFKEAPGAIATSSPGRMARNTALNFLLTGSALLLLNVETRRHRRPAQFLSLAVGFIALQALVGYTYGVASFHRIVSPPAIALHTALTFAVLSVGLLCAHPNRGLMAVVTSETLGGLLGRRLLLAVLVVPLVLGWLRMEGQKAGLYDNEFGLALFATSNVVVLFVVIWLTAASLHETDTERRLNEVALRESEAKYRGLLEAAPDAILSVNRDGQIVLVNSQAEQIFGYERSELLGQPVELLVPERFRDVHPRYRAGYMAAPYTRLLDGGLELWARRKDGREIPVDITLSPLETEQGLLVTAIARDVTERKRQEELHRFFNLSPDLLCIAGFDGYYKRLNPAWEACLGYSLEELCARPYLEFVHPDDREATAGEAEKLDQGVATLFFENRYRAKDGSYRWLLWKATPLPARKLIYAAARDVTERKQAEETRARLAAIVESSEDAILSKDLEGKILSWNVGAEKMYGYTAAEVLGRHVSLLVPPDRPDEMLELLGRIRRGEHILHYESERVRKDGRRLQVSLALSPLKDAQGRVVGASSIARDITERKQAEAALTELNRELEAFTYSVSHDLRAPLRHIDAFARLLQEEHTAALNLAGQHYLERVRQAAQNMGCLLEDLLNFSRIGRRPLNRQITGLGSLVQEVLAELKPDTEGRAIEWKIGPLPFVDCDPVLMKQVFSNLLSNALKYTRPRERTLIEVGRFDQDRQPVVYVRDNGVGFSMNYADKLFGVFQRLHRSEDFEGTGVGLATVQRILHKHGGRVWAEAQLDRGAIFYFSLGASASQESETVSTAPMGGGA